MGTAELVLTDDDGTETVLSVAGLDRLAFERLVNAHPPRPGEQSLWNEATFSPALISACTGQDLGWAEHFWDDGGVDEAEEVLQACVVLSDQGTWSWAKQRLLRDPRLALTVRLCNRAPIPLSHFLGGPLQWTSDDQDLALAALELEVDRCPGGCGMPVAAMYDLDAGRIEQMECFHCEQLEAARAAVPESARGRTHTFIVPVTDAERVA